MSKYVIKNCPAYQKVGVRGSNGKITVLEEVENYCLKEVNSCVACTDCLLKQVYKMCKSQKESCIFAVAFLADRILQLLDIEEQEECKLK